MNIASTSGVRGTAHYAPYVTSKWAIRGLTKTAALELGRDNIQINAIHPGVIATPFITAPAAGSDVPISDFYSPEPFAIPRLGDPGDVTRLLLFLGFAGVVVHHRCRVRRRRWDPARSGAEVRGRMSAVENARSEPRAHDSPLGFLPEDVRRAIEITPAAGTRKRIVDITTTGRRTGRPRRIEIFFYRAGGRTYLCSGAGGGATGWCANLLASPAFTFHLEHGVRADLPARAMAASPTRSSATRCSLRSSATSTSPMIRAPLRRPGSRDWRGSRLMSVEFDRRG